MTAQHHRIRRQVLEVQIQDPAAAWPLQNELARVHRQHLEALVERCCTEVGDPDRLHRIASLEIDLGRLDPEHLERDLVGRLGPLLRQALAQRIREEDEELARTGCDPELESRLELVACFAHHGHLPWWVDASRPRVLDDALELLLRRAAPALVALVRALAREREPLLRLVLHGADAQLSALFEALVAAARLDLPRGAAVLQALSRAHRTVPDVAPARFRAAVWLGALQAASLDDLGAGGPARFWREALGRIAREAGVTYEALVQGLAAIDRRTPGGAGAMDELARSLAHELRGASATGPAWREDALGDATGPAWREDAPRGATGPAWREDAPRGATGPAWREDASGGATELDAALEHLSRPEGLFRDLLTRLRLTLRGAPVAQQTTLMEALRELDRWASAPSTSGSAVATGILRALLELARPGGLARDALAQLAASMPRDQAVSSPTTDATLMSLEGAPKSAAVVRQIDVAQASPEERRTGGEGTGREGTRGSDEAPGTELDLLLERLSRRGPRGDLLTRSRMAIQDVPTAQPAALLEALLEALHELDRRASTPGSASPETAASLLHALLGIIVPGDLARSELAPLPDPVPGGHTRSPRPTEGMEGSPPEPPTLEPAARANDVAREPEVERRAALESERSSTEESASKLDTLLEQLSRLEAPLGELFTRLRAASQTLSAAQRAALQTTLQELERRSPALGTSVSETTASLLSGLLTLLGIAAPGASALDALAPPRSAPDDPSPDRAGPDRLSAPRSEARPRAGTAALQAPRDTAGAPGSSSPARLEEPGRAQDAASFAPAPRPERARAPLRLDPALSEEAYVENAGIVVLWPFLERLFERLELMAEGQFLDDAARGRAAGLLQHLATGDREPAEYDLPLAKVLCGIDPTEVVEFGLPVTDAEAEECANLLTAAIANAPILGELSIDGFRGSFLIRKGVLRTRDGAWLLRVERASYDVVLDRFPWGISWVKSPWMDTPLCVEW